ncbi:MAG: sensor histidine kinase [Thermodesulfovibrionales bacterium]
MIDRLKKYKKSQKIEYMMEDVHDLIKESIEGAERVKRIVQDLKSFSRVDEAEFKMADINEGLESTINIVWNELKYKVTLKKDYGDIPLTKCNPGQLSQVFMNILVNSAQSIEKKGEILVKTWHKDEDIYISISDTGCGIPREYIKRIFEPFFTTKEVGKGTGLGLSIAYDIVKKHKGEIIVQSEIGKGTTFIIKIPIVGEK